MALLSGHDYKGWWARSGAHRTHPMRTAPALISMLCLAAGLAACGGSAASGGTGTSAQASADQALQFSKCMRAHGVTHFPDPGSGGGIQIAPGSGLNPRSPAFQAAQKACRRTLPGGGPSAIKPSKAQYAAALTFARCMRSHGEPNFPDPIASVPAGSGPIITLGGGMIFKPGPGIDPLSPAFQQAASHCGVRLPRPPS
jgi:hypothetical protein